MTTKKQTIIHAMSLLGAFVLSVVLSVLDAAYGFEVSITNWQTMVVYMFLVTQSYALEILDQMKVTK